VLDFLIDFGYNSELSDLQFFQFDGVRNRAQKGNEIAESTFSERNGLTDELYVSLLKLLELIQFMQFIWQISS
jgi:hypothetical protein